MSEKLKNTFLKICNYLESAMSIGVILVIVVLGMRIIFGDYGLFTGKPSEVFDMYIGNIMALAVGVELVKMLSQHSPAAIVEILMFAIARQMIVGHGSAIEVLLGVLSVAVLFAVRKYLFRKTDYKEHTLKEKTTSAECDDPENGIDLE